MLRRARALEQRDVLGLAAGAHVGERAEAALGADFGEEVADRRDERPALAAQVGELDAERLADLLFEDGLGLAQARRRHRLLGQRAADVIVAIDRVIAEEGGADRRAQLGLAGEDAQLRLLHRRLGRELHRAVADDDHRRLAVRGRRDVGDAAREREQEILGADREIADAELPVRIEREAVEAVRRAERLGVGEAPDAVRRRPGRVDRPRPRRRAAALVLDEHLEEHAVGAALGRLLERRAIALADDGAHRPRERLALRERGQPIAVGRRGRRRREDLRRLTRDERLLEPRVERGQAGVDRRRRRRGLGCGRLGRYRRAADDGQAEHDQRARRPPGHQPQK